MFNIIPLPEKIEKTSGEFIFTRDTVLLCDEANRSNAGYLQNLLSIPSSLPLDILDAGTPTAKNSLTLRIDPELDSLGKEGYRLEAHPGSVELTAATPTGVFYAIQTLRQMLPVEVEERKPASQAEWKISCGLVEDRPRFRWRGFMLDEGRHFQGKETVKLLLDLMALHKLNVFHWHLTEDQGWRIEIKHYPRLTEVGAWRDGTSFGFIKKEHNGIRHGGYYTQEEIREIVAYAAARHILVVPEIEIPGHSQAALAAYPELSCTGGPFEVATHFGIFHDICCAGKDETFTFWHNVLDEVLELFPSPYIHIGGDEAPKARWKACPDCQRRIKEQGLPDEHALQVYVTNHMAEYLASKGRRLMGWNEILEPGLTESAVVHFWIGGRHKVIEAIRAGRETVMSTYLDAYLDHSHRLMPLSRAYRYDPIPKELDESTATSVMGLEFPLWTEWVPSRARLDYQAFPRLTAMAEAGWTMKDKKNYLNFRRRLNSFLKRLDRLGVRYAPLNEAEPPFWKRWFSAATIAQVQTRVAGPQQ